MLKIKKEYLLAIFATICWGTFPPVGKLMFSFVSETQLLFTSSLIASIVLVIVNICNGKIKKLRAFSGKDIGILIGLGLLGLLAYNLLYNFGIDHLSSNDACIINYMWPVMTMLFCVIVLGEKMTLRKGIAILISFFGIVVVVTKLQFSSLSFESIPGVLACIGAALSYGLFSALNKKMCYDQHLAMMIYYFVTAAGAGVMMLLAHGYAPLESPMTWVGMLWIGIFGQAVGYLCWSLAIVHGDTAKISNMAYITPFLAIIFAWILLKEPVGIYSLIGLALILLGIFIQLKGKN